MQGAAGMSVMRAVVLAVGLLLVLPILGVALLYVYRTQGPIGPAGADAGVPMMGLALLPMLLFSLVPLAVLFLVVYGAVRLAIRHERESGRTPG
jgi:uncharacterized membrane protein